VYLPLRICHIGWNRRGGLRLVALLLVLYHVDLSVSVIQAVCRFLHTRSQLFCGHCLPILISLLPVAARNVLSEFRPLSRQLNLPYYQAKLLRAWLCRWSARGCSFSLYLYAGFKHLLLTNTVFIFVNNQNLLGNYLFCAFLYFKQNYLLINSLSTELKPICHLLALLGAHHILHISRIRVKRLGLFSEPFK
jgi:hypothetical protein